MSTSLPEGGTQVPQPPPKPHRGTVVLVLGILAIAATVMPFCWIFFIGPIVSVILGIIAWVMGNKDLQEMNQGRMDAAGRSTTNAGRICGIVGLGLAVLFVILLTIIGATMLPAMREAMENMPTAPAPPQ